MLYESYSARRSRVERQARELMAGIRSGQPMGAYRLSRLRQYTDELAALESGVEGERMRRQDDAFSKLLVSGQRSLTPEEQRDLMVAGAGSGAATAGGVLVPVG